MSSVTLVRVFLCFCLSLFLCFSGEFCYSNPSFFCFLFVFVLCFSGEFYYALFLFFELMN